MLVLKTRSLLFDDWWAAVSMYVCVCVCVCVLVECCDFDAEILLQSFWRARNDFRVFSLHCFAVFRALINTS